MFSFVDTSQNKVRKGSVVDFKSAGVSKATKAKAFKKYNEERSKNNRDDNVKAKLKIKQKIGSVSPQQAHSPNVKQAPAAVVVNNPVPVQSPSISEVSAKSASLYYADLPLPERVEKLLGDGCTNEQIAMRLDISLKKVMELRKNVNTNKLIQSPREMFSRHLADFNDAFETARSIYFDDPTSEVSYKVMTDFAKTMRELVKDYNELEDPQEVARIVAHRCLRPLVLKVLKTVVDNSNVTLKTLLQFLSESEQTLLVDGIKNSLKLLQEQINVNYNEGISNLEKIYGVELDSLKATKADQLPTTSQIATTESGDGKS